MIKYFLSQPYFDQNEKNFLNQSLSKGWASTSGPQVKIFEKKLSVLLKSKYAVATNSGTSALHLGLLACDVSKNDEVIAPSLTFIATINAINYVGASPIFFDSDNYYNIKIDDVIKFIDNECYRKGQYTYNKKTHRKIKAIIIVHVWGNAVNINKNQIKKIKSKGIKIIEDSTESLGSFYRGNSLNNKYTGTIGDVGCLSFNGNKIITTGAGGAVICNKKSIYEKVEYLSTQAKNDKYFFVHDDIGYNYKMSNISASIGIAQLKKFKKILKLKKNIHSKYIKLFDNSSEKTLTKTPAYSSNNNWMNILLFPKKLSIKEIKMIIYKMERYKIQVRPIWKLCHLQKRYINCQTYKIFNSIELFHRSLCIPSDAKLKDKDIKFIYNILK